jgi:hypothetical protein
VLLHLQARIEAPRTASPSAAVAVDFPGGVQPRHLCCCTGRMLVHRFNAVVLKKVAQQEQHHPRSWIDKKVSTFLLLHLFRYGAAHVVAVRPSERLIATSKPESAAAKPHGLVFDTCCIASCRSLSLHVFKTETGTNTRKQKHEVV